MLKPVEVYIVKPFPELQICQLPSLLISISHLSDALNKESKKCLFAASLNKQLLDEVFAKYGYHKLIVLKVIDYPSILDESVYTEYCFLDMDMSELLEEANRSRKFQELKTFW